MTGSRGSGIGLALGVAAGIVVLEDIAFGAGIGLVPGVVPEIFLELRGRG